MDQIGISGGRSAGAAPSITSACGWSESAMRAARIAAGMQSIATRRLPGAPAAAPACHCRNHFQRRGKGAGADGGKGALELPASRGWSGAAGIVARPHEARQMVKDITAGAG
ncbi:hypothetical protein [Paracoccus mutanolyticus]|uniref:hypothetical protein n=1 Tax=Paracoccus mutanolyticus TaxID=1499308 RepID=UPI0011AE9E3D|nr:hypothetical protein [Paracoccus mutanolyticus]